MSGSWGYSGNPNSVRVTVPADLAPAVESFINDPEAFVAGLQRTEQALGTVLIEVESGVWVNPSEIAAVIDRPDGCSIRLKGFTGWVRVGSLQSKGVLDVLRTKLNEHLEER